MRKSYLFLFILLIFFFFSQTAFAVVLVSPTSVCAVNATLRLGSAGEEVKCLQRAVGVTADGRFGPITKASVVAFQSKNRLLPDGIVGSLTRMALSRVVVDNHIYPPGCNSTTTYSITTGKKCDGSVASGNSENFSGASTPPASSVVIPSTDLAVGSQIPESLKNPQQNLETYISWEKNALIKKGESSNTISLLEEEIRKYDAENPNALQQFFDLQREIYNRTISKKITKTPLLAFLEKAVSFFGETFSVTKASAQATGSPFGGFIIKDLDICTCDKAIRQIYVALPGACEGISNMTLNYAVGSQAFLNFNIPKQDIAVLGFYTQGGAESCVAYIGESCTTVPAAGQILPMVGSALESNPN